MFLFLWCKNLRNQSFNPHFSALYKPIKLDFKNLCLCYRKPTKVTFKPLFLYYKIPVEPTFKPISLTKRTKEAESSKYIKLLKVIFLFERDPT